METLARAQAANQLALTLASGGGYRREADRDIVTQSGSSVTGSVKELSAAVAKLEHALAPGASARKGLWVQIPPAAPH